MVRIATVRDAEQLSVLNDEFNGKDETTIDNIKNSIANNKQEVVIVDDENGVLVGFVCVQLKKSFCYDEYMPEITEVYVNPTYRKKGIASEMITFAEDYCTKNYPLHKYELLTGKENVIARSVYNELKAAGWSNALPLHDKHSDSSGNFHQIFWRKKSKRLDFLRHTFVSLLVKESQKSGEGISILDVCAIVGHKDAQVTLRVYAGLFPDLTERAMKVLNTCYEIRIPDVKGKEDESCA